MSETSRCFVKKGVVYDYRIEAVCPLDLRIYGGSSPERQAKAVVRWAREVEDFLKNHRDGPRISLTVSLLRQDQCSVCGDEWEEAVDKNGPYCACCGAIKEADDG